jgi:NAD+ synthase (glutamine-hydrolysing)
MKVYVAQLNPTVGDVSGNTRLILSAYAEACRLGAAICVTPELGLTGYPPRDLLDRAEVLDAVDVSLKVLRESTVEGCALVVGAPRRRHDVNGRPLWNSALFFADGVLVAERHKALLPVYDVFDEARYFEGSTSNALIEYRGQLISLTICEDVWDQLETTGERGYDYGVIDTHRGADIAINIAASPFHEGKNSLRYAVLAAAARRVGCPLVYCNQVGANDELVFDGRSGVVWPDGLIDPALAPFAAGGVLLDTEVRDAAKLLEEPDALGEVYTALVLGVRDYFRKSGFSRAVLGVSGGIDSALTAAIAVEALGAEHVIGITMPSRYSSGGSVSDSRELAARLGFVLHEVAIEPVFGAMLEGLAPVFGGREADVTEENLQARIRGVYVMALANKFNALALTTGNKSELATGYCTMYGDMCGALAPLADVLKTQVYALCRWLNAQKAVIPEPTLTKPPSAELRPNQTDQDSLPDYEVLDDIVRGYVEFGRGLEMLVAAGHDEAVVRRVLRLIDLSEYKRRQSAPGLRISTRAFGMGRRYPIAAVAPGQMRRFEP